MKCQCIILKPVHKNKINSLCLSLIPLVLGVLIYVLFRPEEIRLNTWLLAHFSGLSDTRLASQRFLSEFFPQNLAYPFVFTLPQVLWMVTLTTALSSFWDTKWPFFRFLHLVPLIYVLGLEFFQEMHWTDGTFDWLDVVAAPFGWWLGRFFGKKLFCHAPISVATALFLAISFFSFIYWGDVG